MPLYITGRRYLQGFPVQERSGNQTNYWDKSSRMPVIATPMISGGMQAGLDEVDISDQHAKKGCNRFQAAGSGGLGWLVDDRRINKMLFRPWGVGKPIYKKCRDWAMGI